MEEKEYETNKWVPHAIPIVGVVAGVEVEKYGYRKLEEPYLQKYKSTCPK